MKIDEIAPDVFRLSLHVPAAQAEFNAEQSRALTLHVLEGQRSVTVR